MGRVFVVSDVHGYPQIIENALEHGRFDPSCDQLIFAGDVVDRGGNVEKCFELLDRYSATCLLGNHDMAILVGYHIPGQDRENKRFLDRLRANFLGNGTEGKWQVVCCVDGVVMSHAGVSAAYDALLAEECGDDPAVLAALLNDQTRRAVEHELATEWYDESGVLGRCGPLRYRRFECPGLGLSKRFEQIVGHSPSTERLGRHVHMIDPAVHRESRSGRIDSGRYRYAVIENGSVQVLHGTLSSR